MAFGAVYNGALTQLPVLLQVGFDPLLTSRG